MNKYFDKNPNAEKIPNKIQLAKIILLQIYVNLLKKVLLNYKQKMI